MKTRLLVLFAFAGLAIASAKSYTVTLGQPAVLGATQLQPGDYKVEVVGDKAVVRNGKIDAEAPVKVETNNTKYPYSSMRLTQEGDRTRISEIRLGGTNTKLVFNQ